MGMFGYIDVNLPKERSPKVSQIPPETPCICYIEFMLQKLCRVSGGLSLPSATGTGVFSEHFGFPL
jgi:hypothetical protein